MGLGGDATSVYFFVNISTKAKKVLTLSAISKSLYENKQLTIKGFGQYKSLFMKIVFLVTFISFLGGTRNSLPKEWTLVEQTKIGDEEVNIYFFDYMSKLNDMPPDYLSYNGQKLVDFLRNVQFQFPTYIAKRKSATKDSVTYFVLRPDEGKIDQLYFFNLEIVKTAKDVPIELFEDKFKYKDKIVKTIPATRCEGSLLFENSSVIQKISNKKAIIGNGMPIADSIYTRVVPYKEIRESFFKLIESNL